NYTGCISPSNYPNINELHNSSINIAKTCINLGIFGYIGIDYIHILVGGENNNNYENKLIAVDLNIKYTHSLAAFNLFNKLMNGKYECKYTNINTNNNNASNNDTNKTAKYSITPINRIKS